MRLIDADVFCERLNNRYQTENIRSNDNDGYFYQKGWNGAIGAALMALAGMKTIEVETKVEPYNQKNGHWIEYVNHYGYYDRIECSVCGHCVKSLWNMHYCPYCGSKMKGGL